MLVPQCLFPSSVGTSVVTTTSSSAACAVTFLAALPVISAVPFVPLRDVTPSKPNCKNCREVSASLAECLEMLAEFEKVSVHHWWPVVGFFCFCPGCFHFCSWPLLSSSQAIFRCQSFDSVLVSVVFAVPGLSLVAIPSPILGSACGYCLVTVSFGLYPPSYSVLSLVA